MYKALVVAEQKGIITSTDCRWDEGATKTDLLEMLTNAYLAMPTQISASIGISDEPVKVEEEKVVEGNIGMSGDSSQMDYTEEETESKRTVPLEEITEDSEVEDMIVAYPGEIPEESQAVLDDYKEIYEDGFATEAEYKEAYTTSCTDLLRKK